MAGKVMSMCGGLGKGVAKERLTTVVCKRRISLWYRQEGSYSSNRQVALAYLSDSCFPPLFSPS